MFENLERERRYWPRLNKLKRDGFMRSAPLSALQLLLVQPLHDEHCLGDVGQTGLRSFGWHNLVISTTVSITRVFMTWLRQERISAR